MTWTRQDVAANLRLARGLVKPWQLGPHTWANTASTYPCLASLPIYHHLSIHLKFQPRGDLGKKSSFYPLFAAIDLSIHLCIPIIYIWSIHPFTHHLSASSLTPPRRQGDGQPCGDPSAGPVAGRGWWPHRWYVSSTCHVGAWCPMILRI